MYNTKLKSQQIANINLINYVTTLHRLKTQYSVSVKPFISEGYRNYITKVNSIV